jgi:hypothetical protein
MGGYRLNRLTVVLALAAVVMVCVALADALYTQPSAFVTHWPWLVLRFGPPVWLLVAAWLARWEATPARYAVLLAVGFTLVIHAVWFGTLVNTGFGNRTGVALTSWYWSFYASVQQAPALLAVTAFVPAAIGWWQRRAAAGEEP